jgi:hypothetical protein
MCFTVRNGDGYADLEQNYAYNAPNTQNAPHEVLRNSAHLVRNMRNFALKVRSGDAMTQLRSETRKRQVTQS